MEWIFIQFLFLLSKKQGLSNNSEVPHGYNTHWFKWRLLVTTFKHFSSLLKKWPVLTLFKMGLSGAANGWEVKTSPSLKSVTPAMMTFDTVIPYLKKIQKLYKSRDTPLEFCWHEYFFMRNQQILLYQEMQI